MGIMKIMYDFFKSIFRNGIYLANTVHLNTE